MRQLRLQQVSWNLSKGAPEQLTLVVVNSCQNRFRTVLGLFSTCFQAAFQGCSKCFQIVFEVLRSVFGAVSTFAWFSYPFFVCGVVITPTSFSSSLSSSLSLGGCPPPTSSLSFSCRLYGPTVVLDPKWEYRFVTRNRRFGKG